jgi:hypothetical protein
MSTNTLDVKWEEKEVLIIGRGSPEPSKKHIETVCTGAITEDGQLLRLYPIPFRYLEKDKKYKLWTWARFEVAKSANDKRKESYHVKEDSIQILNQISDKSEQFHLLEKGIFKDREVLNELYHTDWTSMGIVEVEMIDFDYRTQQRKNWEKDKPWVKQFELYVERKKLEQLPIEMRIRFRCKNNPHCKAHVSSLIGWEYLEAFRNFRARYGGGLEAFSKIKESLEKNFSDKTKMAYALLGTHFRYASWMVAQVYFFDKNIPKRLL